MVHIKFNIEPSSRFHITILLWRLHVYVIILFWKHNWFIKSVPCLYDCFVGSLCFFCEAWWCIGWFDAFRPKGRRFESSSSRHVGTLGMSFTHSCMLHSAWNSDTVSVLCRGRLWVVVDLKRRYRNSLTDYWLLLTLNLEVQALVGSAHFPYSTHGPKVDPIKTASFQCIALLGWSQE